MKIKIVADSSSNLRHLENINYSCVPLSIRTEEREFIDDENLDPKELVDYLSSYKGSSKTACPNVGDWLKSFEDADIIYCVTIISTLSGSYNAAMVAKQHYEEENPEKKVFVLDSYSAGPEIKLLINKIRDLVLEGKDFDDVCNGVLEYKKHTSLVFCLESLKNLANNGRISHTTATIASLIGIRLIGNVSDNGQIHPVDKTRGSKKSILASYKNMKKQGYNGGTVIIDHCYNLYGANALKEAIKAEYPDAKVIIQETYALCCYYAEKNGLMIGFEIV